MTKKEQKTQENKLNKLLNALKEESDKDTDKEKVNTIIRAVNMGSFFFSCGRVSAEEITATLTYYLTKYYNYSLEQIKSLLKD